MGIVHNPEENIKHNYFLAGVLFFIIMVVVFLLGRSYQKTSDQINLIMPSITPTETPWPTITPSHFPTTVPTEIPSATPISTNSGTLVS